MSAAAGWLRRVRHDLVKRVLWPARDRRDAGGVPAAGELVPEFVDGEGAVITWEALWAAMRAGAPEAVPTAALDAFAAALAAAVAAAHAGDVAGVLTLEGAWDALARIVEQAGEGPGPRR